MLIRPTPLVVLMRIVYGNGRQHIRGRLYLAASALTCVYAGLRLAPAAVAGWSQR